MVLQDDGWESVDLDEEEYDAVVEDVDVFDELAETLNSADSGRKMLLLSSCSEEVRTAYCTSMSLCYDWWHGYSSGELGVAPE